MPADLPPEPLLRVNIVRPSNEERKARLTEIERYSPFWKARPALLVIKPDLALSVSLKNIDDDENYFWLILAVEETIVAPDQFIPEVPMILRCVWNQPYLSLNADLISAPYAFYLHFGSEGVQHVRELSANRVFKEFRSKPGTVGILRSCFSPGFKLPEEVAGRDKEP